MPAKASPTAKDDAAGNGQHIVPALRRGLALLRMFRHDRRVISLPEIVREMNIPRATAFRLAHTLEADGYLQRAPHSTSFQLGINTLALGFEYLASLDLIEVARPILEDLRDRVDASAHLAVQDGLEIVYVATAPSRHRLRGNATVGERRAIHASSIGRAILFDHSIEELRRLFKGVNMRAQFKHAPANATELLEELQQQKADGYAAFRSRFAEGLGSVAAPVRDATGRIVAGVNISDYESLPVMRELEGVIKDEVLRAATLMSRGLGWRPGTVATARKTVRA
jgi:DNA-binding IclR family transcriptional regulator